MKKLSNLFAVAGVLGILIGLSGVGDGGVTGFALAVGAVMFILAFITRAVEKAETIQ